MTQQVVRVAVAVAVVSAFGPGELGTRPVACPPVLIWSGGLSSGRVRRPSRCLGAGASCFVDRWPGERVVGDARSD
jgi:hypothetical protein